MKKTIFLLIGFLMVCSVFAVSLDEIGTDYNGAPSWDWVKTKLGFFDSITIGAKPLTAVGGAMCSEYADWSGSGVLNSDNLCWDNKDGGSPGGNGVVHQGVAFQVMQQNPNDDYKIIWSKEIAITANTRGCVSLPQKGGHYYRQAFYCDDTSKTCTKFISVCNQGDGVLRERTCLFNDGRNVKETVVDTNWKDDSVGLCEGVVIKPLPKQNPTTPGQDGSGVTPATETLAGVYSDVRVPDNVKPNTEFSMSATFTADIEGTYYLEGGIFEKQLAITAKGSKCDGSENFAGEYVDLKAGESVDMIFNVKSVASLGKKTVVIGAFTGCFKDGGEEITSVVDDINVAIFGGSVSGNSIWMYLIIGAIIGLLIGGGAGLAVGIPQFGAPIGAVVGIIGGYLIYLI